MPFRRYLSILYAQITAVRHLIISMDIRVIILAAGKGKRMNSDIPKALVPFRGRPILQHILDAVRSSGVDEHPVIVVGKDNGSVIREAIGQDVEYAVQEEQLGTGHAVRSAEAVLKGKADAIIVLYSDHPLLTGETIKLLRVEHERSGSAVTMLTTNVEDYTGWQAIFYDFGRVVRGADGKVSAIVERRDASPEELLIKEVSPSFFCFKADWLWENLKTLKNGNSQQEYYLTDLVHLALETGETVSAVSIDPREAIGVNTPEQLELAENLE